MINSKCIGYISSLICKFIYCKPLDMIALHSHCLAGVPGWCWYESLKQSERFVYNRGWYPAWESVEAAGEERPFPADWRPHLDSFQVLLSSHPAHSEDVTFMADNPGRSPTYPHLPYLLPLSRPQGKSTDFHFYQNIFVFCYLSQALSTLQFVWSYPPIA